MFAEPPVTPVAQSSVEGFCPIWRGVDALIGVAILVGGFASLYAILGIVVLVVGISEDGLDFVGAIAVIAFEVSFGLPVLWLASRRQISLSAIGFRRPSQWRLIGIAVLGTYTILLAYTSGIELLKKLGIDPRGFEGSNNIPIDADQSTGPLIVLLLLFGLAVVIVAPLAEELLFRALLFRALEGVWGKWAAITCSGVAFGVFHANLAVLIPFTLIGMLFAWSFKTSGSLWVAIIAHFIINSLSFIVTVLEVVD